MDTELLIEGVTVADYVELCLQQHASCETVAASLSARLIAQPEDRLNLSYDMESALLANDALAVWSLMGFENMAHWLNREAEYAVLHCPNVVDAWTKDFESLYLAAHAMTTAFAWVSSDKDKMAWLGGDTSTAGGRLVDRLLRSPESRATGGGWPHFSPAWLGAPQSALRQAACAAGWTPEVTLSMVDLFIALPHTESWLSNAPYPYTAMVCRWISQAQRFPRRGDVRRVVALENARPVDVEMAMALYRASPVALKSALSPHPAMDEATPEERAALRTAVQIQYPLMGLGPFSRMVCTGDILAAREYDDYGSDIYEFGLTA